MHELGMDGTGKLGGAGFACLFVCLFLGELMRDEGGEFAEVGRWIDG